MGEEGNWENVHNFEPTEFKYRPEYASVRLVNKLDQLRTRVSGIFGDPVYIIIHVCAGKRGKHADGSYHYPDEHCGVAMAADLHFSFPDEIHRPVLELTTIQEIGFGGIGYYPGWNPVPGWHLDVRTGKTFPVYWFRDLDGDYQYGLLSLTDCIQEVIQEVL